MSLQSYLVFLFSDVFWLLKTRRRIIAIPSMSVRCSDLPPAFLRCPFQYDLSFASMLHCYTSYGIINLAHAHIKKFFRWHNSLGSGARNASIIYFHLACECWIYMVCIELFWRANWPWQDLSKFQSKRLSYLNSPEKYWAEFEQTETLETAFQPGRLWAKSWYPGGLSKIFLVNLRRYSRTDGCNLVWNTAPSVVHWLYVITHTTSCEPTAHLLKYGRRRSIICD